MMKDYYLKKAEENLPPLRHTLLTPTGSAGVLMKGDSFVIDLGNHYVGYLSFTLGYVDKFIDAPVKLALRFCESERELTDDFADYHGRLSASWLQEEIIHLDLIGRHTMPRRYAARYIKVTVLASPKKLTLTDFVFDAVTSAGECLPLSLRVRELSEIDRVSLNTLKNCMQRVFEDGPKRDRRLWIGDLRLEALANSVSYRNFDLVRRCLYLFAAAEKNVHGFMPGFVFEEPIFAIGDWYLEDYSLMYVATLCDHLAASGDSVTFDDLYPVAKGVMDAMDKTLDGKGIVSVMPGCDAFIDWCPGLEKRASLHGVYLYVLDLWCKALTSRGMDATLYENRLVSGREAVLRQLYGGGIFVSGYDKGQYSVHSTVWLILGGVLMGDAAQKSLLAVLSAEDSVKPFTPYMHHYVIEALMKVGLSLEAEAYLRKVWGGMLCRGADTFFEVYVADDPDFSPYGDRKINSMCHAWSCTPTYFIRKFGLGKGESI